MRYDFQSAINVNQVAEHAEASVGDARFDDVLYRVQSLALRTSQWVTVIGGCREAVAQLVAAGVSRNRIRWIGGRDHDHREWATEQALLAGTSSVVLSFLEQISPRMQQRIKMASKMSQTHSFVFNELPSRTPLH